jgi:hypothetical protein
MADREIFENEDEEKVTMDYLRKLAPYAKAIGVEKFMLEKCQECSATLVFEVTNQQVSDYQNGMSAEKAFWHYGGGSDIKILETGLCSSCYKKSGITMLEQMLRGDL